MKPAVATRINPLNAQRLGAGSRFSEPSRADTVRICVHSMSEWQEKERSRARGSRMLSAREQVGYLHDSSALVRRHSALPTYIVAAATPSASRYQVIR